MAYRVMERRETRRILREQEALETGYLLTPFGKLLRVRLEDLPAGGWSDIFEEVSEEDFGVLYVVGCG